LDANGRVVPEGYVCIDNDVIAAVVAIENGIPAAFAQAPRVQTTGTIYPGLVELHNHPAYNEVPLWSVPKRYPNRDEWMKDPLYIRQVRNPATILTHHPQEIYPKSVARFVESRALLGGVTTTQGLTFSSLGNTVDYYRGLVRIVEFAYGPNWPTANDHIPNFTSFSSFQQYYAPLMNQPLTRAIMHLCEGTDQGTRQLFTNLIDPSGQPLIGSNLIAIHGTALREAEFSSLKLAGGLIWSPTSNFLLYGETTDVKTAIASGVVVAIGCDWTPSGTKNLLGELKIAKLTSAQLGGLFTDEQLVRMVTTIPAKMMGWDQFLGSVEVGKQADLLVIGKKDGDPYSALIASTESDVAAVLIGGRVRAGRASLVDPGTPDVELIHVAKQSMVLDLVNGPGDPLAKITLQGAIATLSYALEHLPDLTETFKEGHAELRGTSGRFRIQLEVGEPEALAAVSGDSPIGPGDVDRMALDPITAVDDSTFNNRLKKNINLPQWLKDEL